MKQIIASLNKNGHRIVATAIVIYCAVFSLASVWKYQTLQYNALDLAIINQVFYNSAQGNWFASSIHPSSYLGDHVELIILGLLPFYLLFQSPLVLLVLQTVALALVAWPIYLIAKNALNKSWAVFFSLAWLANPFVQNINLFEFHLLPFALIFIFFAFYFFQIKNFWLFLTFAVLAMLVREDVALVIFFFGALALTEKRAMPWIVVPIFGSIGYFFTTMQVNSWFAVGQNYKFLIYYSWLGQNINEVAVNLLTKPHRLVVHLMQFRNIEFLLGLLLPFAFLPLLAPVYLILALGVYAQFILGSSGTSSLLLTTHYSALLLPAVFIAWIFAVKKVVQNQTGNLALSLFYKQFKALAQIILAAAVLYSSLTLGPLPGLAKNFIDRHDILAKNNKKNEALKLIPNNAAVVATYEFLTPLSAREGIYAFNYIFLGKQQFLTQDYALPPDTEYLAIDFEDLITYESQYGQNDFYRDQYQARLVEWQRVLDQFGLIYINDTVAIFKKGEDNQFDLVKEVANISATDLKNVGIENNLVFLGNDNSNDTLKLFWQITGQLKKNYSLRVNLSQDNETKFSKFYSLGYGLMVGQADKKIQTNYWFDFSHLKPGTYDLQIDVVEILASANIVNSVRGTSILVTEEKIVADKIVVQKITLD